MFGRKDTTLTIRGSDILLEALPIILTYPRKVGKHSSSNGCLYSCLSVIFPGLIRCSKLVILGQMFEFVLIKRRCIDHKGIRYAVKGYFDNVPIPKEG